MEAARMQADEVNIADGLSNMSVKRKRGRPRKYPRQENAVRYENLNMGANAPGFVRSNGNQAAPNNGGDSMVGMAVSGVVEASFDAGYLLRVRVGNTGTSLRGIVFKPGHYAPVVPENDVAPDVEMIRRRQDVPLPVDNHSGDASRPVVPEPLKLSPLTTPVVPQAATSKGKEVGCSVPKMLGSQPLTSSDQVMFDAKPKESGPVEELPKQMRLPAEPHREAVAVEPLQSGEPKDHLTSASKPMEDGRNDKMSELLQVLQESMKERMKDQTEKLFGDEQNDHSSTPSQAS